jgi:NADH-ubiquinone oxidoreductase chain 1
VESELVSGFMTEHSAVIFVFFFLAEYASIVLICILTSVLFLGGYLSLLPVDLILFFFNSTLDVISYIYGYSFFNNTFMGNISNINVIFLQYDFFYMEKEMFKAFLDTLLVSSAWSSLNLAIKTSTLIFIFI